MDPSVRTSSISNLSSSHTHTTPSAKVTEKLDSKVSSLALNAISGSNAATLSSNVNAAPSSSGNDVKMDHKQARSEIDIENYFVDSYHDKLPEGTVLIISEPEGEIEPGVKLHKIVVFTRRGASITKNLRVNDKNEVTLANSEKPFVDFSTFLERIKSWKELEGKGLKLIPPRNGAVIKKKISQAPAPGSGTDVKMNMGQEFTLEDCLVSEKENLIEISHRLQTTHSKGTFIVFPRFEKNIRICEEFELIIQGNEGLSRVIFSKKDGKIHGPDDKYNSFQRFLDAEFATEFEGDVVAQKRFQYPKKTFSKVSSKPMVADLDPETQAWILSLGLRGK